MNSKNGLRIVGAIAALVSGAAHLKLYSDGYKDFPGNIGIQFLFNALGALAIAVGLLAPLISARTPTWIPYWAAIGGIGWALISLVGFAVARTDTGWFGFNDAPGFVPSPEAQLSVFPEVIVLGASALLLSLSLFGRSARD